MKKTLLILGILLTVVFIMPVHAQTNEKLSKKEQRKLEKQKKKAAKEAEELADFNLAKKMVTDTTFVFVANQLYTGNGKTLAINPALNFLTVNKKDATYQFSFHGIIGWNGVGGATFNGTLTQYELKMSDNINKASYIQMIFRPKGVGGLPYINITFFGTKATVDVTLDNGTRFTLDGVLKPINEAEIIKGHSVF
jgi:hypothetical protein